MAIEHRGMKQFLEGTFENGGDNLFVDARGVLRRIMDNDLNGDGIFDIVLPNSHGYIERAPTYIYTQKEDVWEKIQLPHDSCWKAKIADVDGDGYPDLLIANGENGVSSSLKSYLYWGGPSGLTGERVEFDTIGAYDVDAYDLCGSGRKAVLFTTAWYDHHNPGVPMYQKVFEQVSARVFEDATEKYRFTGVATVALLCDDLNGNGFPSVALANFREGFQNDTDSFVYIGGPEGFDTDHPVRLPTQSASQVMAADLNGDGRKELIFSGGNQILIYWNTNGRFCPQDCFKIEIEGLVGQFMRGLLPIDIADIDADGMPELVIGTKAGVEIRKTDDLAHMHRLIPCFGCSGVKAADIRRTGFMDIIASNYCSVKTYDTQSTVFWNREGEYSPDDRTAFETHGPMGCDAADFDGDGIMEIVFCNTMAGPSQLDPEFPVFAYYGTPDHRYITENRRDYPVNMMCHAYAAADVDNDGYNELLVTSCDGIRIFKGTPDGPDPRRYEEILHPSRGKTLVGGLLVGDFNHDGWLDVIMVPWVYGTSQEELENSVFVCYGGPDGYSIERSAALPCPVGSAQSILLVDIDRDGYTDFIYGDNRGFLGVFYGGKDGFSRERTGRITLKDYNGATFIGITAADVNHDGWPELFVTTAGHYTRRASHLYILKDGEHGYPEEAGCRFDTGGTTGFPALADMRKRGVLDLLLPFYSTSETRELPARIFSGDGKGDFDWDNPFSIHCLASIAFSAVDLTGNGYPDLFICCHRNDLGHTVDSLLIMNGPEGLDVSHAQGIPGYGPHSFTSRDQGNAADRSASEYYRSPVFECRNPQRIEWEGKTPWRTSLRFYARFGENAEDVLKNPFCPAIERSGSPLASPKGTTHMQYRIEFSSPGLVNSAELYAVRIHEGE